MKRAGLAATIKARWICEQAHQQLKEKLGLDHFEGRSWQGLHRHALMTMIAYAFLQHRHLTQVGRKKESTDRRLSLACRPYATPSSISFFDHYLSNAHTAEDEAVKNSGVGKSAKVVLASRGWARIRSPPEHVEDNSLSWFALSSWQNLLRNSGNYYRESFIIGGERLLYFDDGSKQTRATSGRWPRFKGVGLPSRSSRVEGRLSPHGLSSQSVFAFAFLRLRAAAMMD